MSDMEEVHKQTKSDKLRRSKEYALSVLATTTNYSEAARIIGCGHQQIYEWLKDQEFKEALDKLRSKLVEDAISKMKAHTTKAVDTLALLMDDESAQIRRGAANDILTHVGRFMELKEIEVRLNELERRISKNQ